MDKYRMNEKLGQMTRLLDRVKTMKVEEAYYIIMSDYPTVKGINMLVGWSDKCTCVDLLEKLNAIQVELYLESIGASA